MDNYDNIHSQYVSDLAYSLFLEQEILYDVNSVDYNLPVDGLLVSRYLYSFYIAT